MPDLPNNQMYLPRNGKFHYSDYVTYKSSPKRYFQQFVHGRNNLNTPAIRFGSYIMELLEHNQSHKLVSDLPVYPYVEYDLKCMLGGIVPIETHPDSLDIDDTLSILEYKTALVKNAWTTKKVYNQIQITFYAMCVRELKGHCNKEDNFLIEIPTQRITHEEIDGLLWENSGEEKYLEISRLSDNSTINGYAPHISHRRVVTELEMDKLREDVIKTALEASKEYRNFLSEQLKNI